MKKSIVLIVTFFLTIETGFGFSSDLEKLSQETDTNGNSQIGIYYGYVFGETISNASGNHGAIFGYSYETSIEGIDIEQNWSVGLNIRYLFTNYFGLDFDLMYSPATLPEQQVSIDGVSINQPKSDLNFYTISIGPFFRYKSTGLYQHLNPYISIALSIPFGSANDVDLSPVYAESGSASLNGIGFNLSVGTQYSFDRFALSLEYRFEYLDMTVDRFRSFTQGLSFTKSGSYIIFAGCYNF